MSVPRSLPLSAEWADENSYVDSLLNFASNTELFRNLCGGIHVLDFLTREPDLYSTVLPGEWREWFEKVTTEDILDLLLRQDLDVFDTRDTWQGLKNPPQSLLDYVSTVRKYCLVRKPEKRATNPGAIPPHIAVGMKTKKMHEVANFASFVDDLSEKVAKDFGNQITDIVDFGSGQNYLGRTLASPPYNRHVIAIERRHHVVEGARGMDVHAKLATKKKIIRNKKEWKRQIEQGLAPKKWRRPKGDDGIVTPQTPGEDDNVRDDRLLPEVPGDIGYSTPQTDVKATEEQDIEGRLSEVMLDDNSSEIVAEIGSEGVSPSQGRVTYIEHDIKDGHLEGIISQGTGHNIYEQHCSKSTEPQPPDSSVRGRMVVSIHSCGNLVHHGLRSIVLNPSVAAIAMIGCCYNLMTERLGPATYKLPVLRSLHPRLEATSSSLDPHGFPMSRHLENFEHAFGKGLRLNITARMMAVQAPYNWGPDDCEAFFRRHFYRALLQRILVDLGVVNRSSDQDGQAGDTSIDGMNAAAQPLIVGTLRKAAFSSFHAYAHAAINKLSGDANYGKLVREKTAGLDDEKLSGYEMKYGYHKKRLATIWSLMAFSAGVVESIIAVDRWLYLREQDCIEACWVEPVFDYTLSPRNLVVVGIKKRSVVNEPSSKPSEEAEDGE